MNPTALSMTPIGHVRGGRLQATKDGWGDNRCRLELDPARFGPEALMGLESHSHVELLFFFHIDADEATETGARHPRGRADWPRVGIFAQHGRMRPNRIGASICRLIAVEGLALELAGLDAVDGTPVLDIKPVWREYLPREAVRQPDWTTELMARYW